MSAGDGFTNIEDNRPTTQSPGIESPAVDQPLEDAPAASTEAPTEPQQAAAVTAPAAQAEEEAVAEGAASSSSSTPEPPQEQPVDAQPAAVVQEEAAPEPHQDAADVAPANGSGNVIRAENTSTPPPSDAPMGTQVPPGDTPRKQQSPVAPAPPPPSGGPSPYTFSSEIIAGGDLVASERGETNDYYMLALEFAGVKSIRDITPVLRRTPTGYEVSVEATKQGAFGSGAASELSTRKLGKILWQAHIVGVFVGTPQMNFAHGLFKLRLQKRSVKAEHIHIDAPLF